MRGETALHKKQAGGRLNDQRGGKGGCLGYRLIIGDRERPDGFTPSSQAQRSGEEMLHLEIVRRAELPR
ncbi:hypothetical protein MKL20_29050 [Methylobacterium sp. E-066]|nr:hypothetical protein [Methylobacterium sp. E-066]